MISKTTVKGFCVILSETRYTAGNLIKNVRLSEFTKKYRKNKLGYSAGIEYEKYDNLTVVSNKTVFPLLNIEELQELFDSFDFTSPCKTLGSITKEYGHIHALSLYEDQISISNDSLANIYLSVIFDFENFDEVQKNSHCMNGNHAFQIKIEESLFDEFSNLDVDWNKIENLCKKSFVYDNGQFEIKFETV